MMQGRCQEVVNQSRTEQKKTIHWPKQNGQNVNQRSRIHHTENQNTEQHELNWKHGVNSGATCLSLLLEIDYYLLPLINIMYYVY